MPGNAQGELQGAFAGLMSITSVIGPLLMNSIFAWFVRPDAPVYFPGAAMLLGAALTALSGWLAHRTFQRAQAASTRAAVANDA